MNTGYAFGPAAILAAMGGAFVLIVAAIYTLRWFIRRQSNLPLTELNKGRSRSYALKARNKYPEVDVFQFSKTGFYFGLAIAMALTVTFFNWTSTEKTAKAGNFVATIDEDIEIEIPRSSVTPPPPPLPPPPSVIKEVPDEMILEDPVTFVDQSVDAETEVIAAPVVERKREFVPPPPPPPPAEEVDVDEIFKIVEEFPRFPGCEDMAGTAAEKKACADRKMLEFIYDNIRYPHVAVDNGIEGTVLVKFVVERDGRITGLEVLKDIGGECGKEAMRVVELMNDLPERWTPGKQRNVPVRVIFNLPVRFKIQPRT